MKDRKQRMMTVLLYLMRILPIVLIVAVVISYFLFGKDLSLDMVIDYVPRYPLAAAVIVVIGYGLKSLSVFFPLAVIYVAVGNMFPAPFALLINLIGLVVCFTLPYSIGSYFGQDFIKRLEKKYPKIQHIIEYEMENQTFFVFFIKKVGIIPGDISSMLLGALNIRYPNYLIGVLLASVPTMVATTFLGVTLDDPGSPGFILSVVSTILILLITFFLCLRHRKKQGKEKTL